MGKRVVCLTAVLVAVGCAMAGQHAGAETMAIQDWSVASSHYAVRTSVNLGYEFTVGTDSITVTKLGVFDYGAGNDGDTFGSHEVGIWEVTGDHELVAFATVTDSSPLEGTTIDDAGQFRFEELSSTVELSANATYRIAAYYGSTNSDAATLGDTGDFLLSTADEIAYVAPYYGYTGGLAYPNDLSGRPASYFGPNFQFVPEPGTLGLLLSVGVVALVVLVQRRRSR